MWECVHVFFILPPMGFKSYWQLKNLVYILLIAQPFPFLLHRCFDKTVLPNKLAPADFTHRSGQNLLLPGVWQPDRFGCTSHFNGIHGWWARMKFQRHRVATTERSESERGRKWSWVLPNCSEPLDHDFVGLHVLPSIRAFSTWPFRSCF